MRLLPGLGWRRFSPLQFPFARAKEWCGFLDKKHARVRCGYSSQAERKQSLGGKKDASVCRIQVLPKMRAVVSRP